MSISVLLWIFGGVLLLLGIIKTVIYIKENKEFEGYKTTKGCVVEHVSKAGHHYFDDEEFGYDAINYDEDDRSFLVEDGINSDAGIIEFVIKDKKYRFMDSVNDSNLMPIGEEVSVKYNPKKPKDAFIGPSFDGAILYGVGVFLIFIGTYTHLFM